jgi:amino acid transporter
LGQAGATVKGAYDVLVSMAVIATFLPYLALFAAMVRLQAEPTGPGVIRVPGGAPAAIVLASTGIATTLVAIALAALPPADAPNPALAVAKVVGGSAVLVGAGPLLYRLAHRRRDAACAAR